MGIYKSFVFELTFVGRICINDFALFILLGDEHTRRSTLSIRVCMKDFCVEFIKKCYNPLMRAVKVSIVMFQLHSINSQ